MRFRPSGAKLTSSGGKYAKPISSEVVVVSALSQRFSMLAAVGRTDSSTAGMCTDDVVRAAPDIARNAA
jgi:hypothetical protein